GCEAYLREIARMRQMKAWSEPPTAPPEGLDLWRDGACDRPPRRDVHCGAGSKARAVVLRGRLAEIASEGCGRAAQTAEIGDPPGAAERMMEQSCVLCVGATVQGGVGAR